MKDIYYKGLTGSRLWNTNLENSDTDYTMISNIKITVGEKGTDIFYRKASSFVFDLLETDNIIAARYALLTLFSKSVMTTSFSDYVVKHREQLVISNLQRFGWILFENAKSLITDSNKKNGTPQGQQFPKRLIVASIFLNAYIRYAKENISFYDALTVLPDNLKEFIFNIRLNKISYEEQRAVLNKMLEEAQSVKEFYEQEIDLNTFNSIKNTMIQLLKM